MVIFMRKLLKNLKDYKLEIVLGPIFKLLEACFELLVPLIVSAIIDNGIANGDKPLIYKMCGILAVLGIVGLVCSLTAQYFAAKAAIGFGTKVRSKLFSHIQSFSFSQLDSLGASTLITRLIGDTNQVQSGVNLTLRLVLRSPLVVLGAIIMAFTVDASSALIFVVTVPLLTVVVFSIMLVSIPLYKKVQARLDIVLSKTRGNLRGSRVIRAFCKENDEISSFNNSNDELTKMQILVGKVSSFLNPVTFVIINLAIIALIYKGALRVELGEISNGQVVALYNYMSQILVELIKLASVIITITKAIASGKRIQAVLDIEPDVSLGDFAFENNNENAVEFQNVTLAYNSDAENALENISFSVKRGTTVGIIGSTGSGKSSLVNLIPAFYKANSGKVLVNGVDVNDYDADYLRKIIGIVPQKAVLFKGTIRENICIGKADATDNEICEALKTAQAENILTEKVGGLGCLIEQEGKNLSGGQKQRLTIARAIVKKPQILILDDSSSALDYATGAALKIALHNTDFSPTVIIVSQRANAVQNADNIIVLDDGKIVGMGSSKELLETCEVYKEIWNSQLKAEAKTVVK